MTVDVCRRLAVFGSTAVMTAGLVTTSTIAGPPVDALARVEAAAVQLQAQVTSLLQDDAFDGIVALATTDGIEATADVPPAGADGTEGDTGVIPEPVNTTDPVFDAISALITVAAIVVGIPLVILLSPVLIPLSALAIPFILTGVGDITRCGSPFCSFTKAPAAPAAAAGATASAEPADEPAIAVTADTAVSTAEELEVAVAERSRLRANASPRRPVVSTRGPAAVVSAPKAASSVRTEAVPTTAALSSPESESASAPVESPKVNKSAASRAARNR